jgi:hypothetical protein
MIVYLIEGGTEDLLERLEVTKVWQAKMMCVMKKRFLPLQGTVL